MFEGRIKTNRRNVPEVWAFVLASQYDVYMVCNAAMAWIGDRRAVSQLGFVNYRCRFLYLKLHCQSCGPLGASYSISSTRYIYPPQDMFVREGAIYLNSFCTQHVASDMPNEDIKTLVCVWKWHGVGCRCNVCKFGFEKGWLRP